MVENPMQTVTDLSILDYENIFLDHTPPKMNAISFIIHMPYTRDLAIEETK